MASRSLLREAILLTGLTAVALALRLYRLEAIPPGFHGDEAAFGMEAARIARGEWIGIWTGVTLGHPTGHLYWTALLVKVFGPSVFSVRLAMALVGTLTVPAAYLLLRQLFSFRVAFTASAFIAFSFWHLVYSRAGWTIAPAVLLLLLSLACLFRSWQRGSWPFAIAGGILLGLGFYTHKNFPFYYAGVWAFGLARIVLDRSVARRQLTGVFLLLSVVAAAPFLDFLAGNYGLFLQRLKLESFFEQPFFQNAPGVLGKAGATMLRVLEVLFLFHFWTPVDYVDGTGGRPLMGVVLSAFFWLGLVVTARRLKEPAYQLLAIGWLAGSLPPMLAVTGEQRRLLGAMPFMMAYAALGLEAAILWGTRLAIKLKGWARERQGRERLLRASANVGLTLFLLSFAITNASYYFVSWPASYQAKLTYAFDLVKAIEYLKAHGSGAYVYFYADRWSFNYETRQFLLPGLPGEDRSTQFGGDGTLERRHSGKVVYVLLGEYTRLADDLRALYPEGPDEGNDFYEARDTDGRAIFAALVSFR
ncbi:MAG: glycosyltransferase family 39 protein [Chloroflexi bacterium]|nr:glycosyltransferase family 39 protein [Chloroflexota bacterium]